jgi:hypothetical protein
MNSDFYDACLRHLDDAEQLFQAQRWANSDHLFGISAECGLKRLMIAFGMTTDQHGTPTAWQDKVHVEKAWERFETYRSGHHQGAHYGLGNTHPFQDWDVYQRYAGQSNFNQKRVDPHRTAARQVYDLLKLADRDGLL